MTDISLDAIKNIRWSKVLMAPGMMLWFWLINMALAVDQLGNAILFGDPDETISRRAGRARDKDAWWGCWLCKLLDWIDERHCQKAADRITDEEGFNSVWKLLGRWKRDNPQD